MSRGRRVLLAVWIVANAAVLSLLILNPHSRREVCTEHPAFEFSGEQIPAGETCEEGNFPLLNRRYVLAGTVLGNGVFLALWVTTRSRDIPPESPK